MPRAFLNRFTTLCLVVACALTPGAQGQDEAAPGFKFFEQKIRPLLAARCFKCHGAEQQKGGLRLDSKAAVLTGGDTGAAIVEGKPDESLMIESVRYSGLYKMPPTGQLPAEEIALLAEWVRLGAPWTEDGHAANAVPSATSPPADAFTPEQLSFWAFQRPVQAALPAVAHAEWCQSPIDYFVLAQLEQHQLSPAPTADKRTLIRRATFDLIGLPPEPNDVENFLQDNSPAAFAKVIDRLLASPQYGQRWGRHWLDVARYADSNGLDENLAYVNAWRYRDYVVSAFNTDKPYDRFVQEQIAGDLLDASSDSERYQLLTATGFLTIGAKMLAEDDPVKMEMDIIDEQLDTLGGAILGLTLGCARCHDHKFDPIPTADYYSLAGIFKSTKTMDNFKVVAQWHERPLAPPDEAAKVEAHNKKVADNKAQQDVLMKKAGDGSLSPDAAAMLESLKNEAKELEKVAPPALPASMSVEEGQPTNLQIHIRGSHLALGSEVPRRFPKILAGADQLPLPADHSGRLELARWITDPSHPLTSRVLVNRVWRGHFGEALVRSPDNFGNLGDRPANPALLDWLAVQFIKENWSIKNLHRTIMLSSTYQMSCAYNEAAALADPDNRLNWRMNRRRLEAEAIRDSILHVSGGLDLAFGGSLLQAKPREYVAGTASVNLARYDSRRRSIYLPVIRSALYDVFQAFDFAEPSVLNGNRSSTTVAPQAMFMMNSELVSEATDRLAKWLLAASAMDDAKRVETLYQIALSRPPREQEVTRALHFVEQTQAALPSEMDAAQRRSSAWQSLCRVIMSTNEFIYVE